MKKKKVTKKQRKSPRLRCQDCGVLSYDVKICEDPYVSEVLNASMLIQVCDDCCQKRAEDI